MEKEYKNLTEFYPYYLTEHVKKGTRLLHFLGTTLFFCWIILAVAFLNPWFVLVAVFNGYFFAWIGHFFVEKNKPATFKYPILSLISDFKLYFQILTGKEKF